MYLTVLSKGFCYLGANKYTLTALSNYSEITLVWLRALKILVPFNNLSQVWSPVGFYESAMTWPETGIPNSKKALIIPPLYIPKGPLQVLRGVCSLPSLILGAEQVQSSGLAHRTTGLQYLLQLPKDDLSSFCLLQLNSQVTNRMIIWLNPPFSINNLCYVPCFPQLCPPFPLCAWKYTPLHPGML